MLLIGTLGLLDMPIADDPHGALAHKIVDDIAMAKVRYLVADQGGEIVGCVGMALYWAPAPYEGRILEVVSLHVSQMHRGSLRRIHRLTEGVLEYAESFEAALILCGVVGDRRDGYYRRQGFKPLKTMLAVRPSESRRIRGFPK
jgi:N-acetylglutamate synthase-like GNAT family acetyltransferase